MADSQRRALGPGFRLLITAAAVSTLGDGIGLTAAPLLAKSLTDDARLIAGLGTAQMLPWLVMTLFSGALVDRLDRRKVMWIVDACRAVGMGAITLLVATDTAKLPLLYVLFFALGIGETLFNNASVAMLPAIVGVEDLNRANGRLQSVETIMFAFVGPPIGGFLFAAATAVPFGLDAASFAVSAFLIARIATSHHTLDVPAAAGGEMPDTSISLRGILADVREGVRFLFAHRLLRRLAGALGVWNLVANANFLTVVILASDRLHLGDRGFGLLLAGGAIGAVFGGFAADRIISRLGSPWTLRLAIISAALADFAVPFTHSPYVVAAVMCVNGFAGTVWNVLTITLRQVLVPDRLLGRVTSAYRLIGMGSIPIAGIMGGVLVHRYGPASTYWVSGFTMTAVGAWAFAGGLGPKVLAEAEATTVSVGASDASAGS